MRSEEGSTSSATVHGAGGDGGAGEVVEVHHRPKRDDPDAGGLRKRADGPLYCLLHTQPPSQRIPVHSRSTDVRGCPSWMCSSVEKLSRVF